MKKVGISLGWSCEAATYGVENNIRAKKEDGYLTCPFDGCLSNYDGIIECLKDDFKYFVDPNYLEVIEVQFNTVGLSKYDKLLYNKKYKFIFNHESPGHGNLYITQNWPGGINHYIDNNYKYFIERYTRRIQSFRNYLEDNNNDITFILARFNKNIDALKDIIKLKYPNLIFNIIQIKPYFEINRYKDHLKILGLSDAEIENEIKET